MEYSHLRHSQCDIQFYTELSESLDLENITAWLSNMLRAPKKLKEKCKLIFCGLFLQSSEVKVVKLTSELLTQVALEDKDFSCLFLTSVLHKLTKVRDYESSKIILFIVPELIESLENSPMIIGVLRKLSIADEPLRFVALELYLRAWKRDKKCHKDLVAALSKMMREESFWEANLCCAKIMKV